MIRLVEIDREERRNALDTAEVGRLRAEFAAAAADQSVRAVVLCAAGTRSFCAGQDVKELALLDRTGRLEAHAAGQGLMDEIAAHPCLVIAAIEGWCLGGGLELTLACDLRIAGAEAVFGLPEVGRDLLPTWGAHHRLAPVVGAGRARELVLAGRRLDADEALRWGLISTVVPTGQARLRAGEAAAEAVSGSSRRTIATAKALLAAGALDPGGASERDRQAEAEADDLKG